MRIVLCGLTGFGNSVLRGIRATRGEVVAVLTRRESGSFPYYPERNLSEETKEAGIPAFEDLALDDSRTLHLYASLRPDLLLVSTYHQRIPTALIQATRGGALNLHPSLLPRYRGPTPTTWCLIAGETETGVTAHYVTADLDVGPIAATRRIPIAPEDTDGTLRSKLARASGELAAELVRRLMHNEVLPSVPQDEQAMTYFRKRTRKDLFITFHETTLDVYNRVRAGIPYPGPYTTWRGEQIAITGASILPGKSPEGPPGLVVGHEKGNLHVTTKDGMIVIRTGDLPDFDPSRGDALLGR